MNRSTGSCSEAVASSRTAHDTNRTRMVLAEHISDSFNRSFASIDEHCSKRDASLRRVADRVLFPESQHVARDRQTERLSEPDWLARELRRSDTAGTRSEGVFPLAKSSKLTTPSLFRSPPVRSADWCRNSS